jgi:hypothetical protein
MLMVSGTMEMVKEVTAGRILHSTSSGRKRKYNSGCSTGWLAALAERRQTAETHSQTLRVEEVAIPC